MTIPAIHPGEHLAEELRELDMSAASLARQIEVPASRITENPQQATRNHWRYSPEIGSLFRHQCRVLAKFAEAL